MSLGEATFARSRPAVSERARLVQCSTASTSRLLALLLFNLVFTDRFLEIDNIRLQFVQVVPVAIIALGMAVVIGTKGIDLSVGSVMAISSALLALYLGYGPIVAVLVALLGGAAVGLVNGILIARFQIQPIVATLALLVGGRGSGPGHRTGPVDRGVRSDTGHDRISPVVRRPDRRPDRACRCPVRRRADVEDHVRAICRRHRRQPRGELAGRRSRSPDPRSRCTSCALCWPRSPE